jgi:C_GCAxxG_C_C family probable redox protein
VANIEALKAQLRELAERSWTIPEIRARLASLAAQGISPRVLDAQRLLADRAGTLRRVQQRAEEYNFVAGNCARSTALAVMEEFGLGNMEVIKALSPFPGFGSTGWMCGGVSGGLIAVGLCLGSNDFQNHAAAAASMIAGRRFMEEFEKEVGAVTCRKIQEDLVFGRFMDPGASPENMQAFAQAQGFQKCSLLAGIGARVASGIIIDSLQT